MRSSGIRINNAELWGGVIWFALGVFVLEQGRQLGLFTVDQLQLDPDAPKQPGMGFAMFGIGLIMCGLAAWIAVHAITTEGPTVGSLWSGTRWGKALIVIVTLVVYSYSFSRLGFLLSTIPMMLILLRAIDPVRWPLTIALAFGMPLAVWWVLKRLLLIQLPAGIFEIG